MGKPCLFQCSIFWAFSLFIVVKVYWYFKESRFDAQFSELFLYGSMIFYLRNGLDKFRCSTFWAFSLCGNQEKQRRRKNLVSMLNVLSFFFILIFRSSERGWWSTFRCSMFWAFSLCSIQNNHGKNRSKFRCSMFWAFSLWQENIHYKRQRSSCFDAQCFELFLYLEQSHWKEAWQIRFDAQCFELFLYQKAGLRRPPLFTGFDAQCFELFLYSFFKIPLTERKGWVSMLNVLSFFFIHFKKYLENEKTGFDAQCFELFLYSTLYNCNE